MSQPSFGTAEEVVIEDAKLKLDLARQRLADLVTFGITRQWLDQLHSNIQAYEALAPDSTLLAMQKSLTADKDDTLKQIERWGSFLRDRCKFAFGSGPRNPFPLSSFRSAITNESKMLQVLPSLVALANQYDTALSSFGQPSDYASQGQLLRDRLDQLNRQQEMAKRERKIATSNRRQAAKTVYDQLRHLNEVARAVYRDQPTQRDLFRGLIQRTTTTVALASAPAD
ncbi:hypothetical protein [Leptolyngbya sp. FACHB-261]|uniref:hypothetical protein n=1 Tax=Leptolyngbya sp. FACHB-261 TaxID=2692806 RepID=UPI0016829582|nr:hypothetical protein [Leptolyngbya sp. FACHB-261]MBD2101578.1 hypothetical protein [Leptolyngbya sp. FACHB-261]